MRRSIRLPGFDYSGASTYFVTLVAAERAPCFGELIGRRVVLSEWGTIVHEEWLRSARLRDYIELDAHVVMPDHFHAIARFTCPSVQLLVPPAITLYRPPRSLGSLIARFKASCTRRINLLRGHSRSPIWQRNYYESIVRDEAALARIRRYILLNPVRGDRNSHGMSGTGQP